MCSTAVVILLRQSWRDQVNSSTPMRLRFLSSTITLLLMTQIHPADPCGPGRGHGLRRTGRRSTPLVLRQHVPNVPETSLAASGPAEGRIDRGTDRFRRLVVNDNVDVLFKNDEGNGEDLIMSKVCIQQLINKILQKVPTGLYLTGGQGVWPPARGSWPSPPEISAEPLWGSTLTPLRTLRFHFLAKPVYLCTRL